MSDEICCINMSGKYDEEKIQYVQYESLSIIKLLIMSLFTLGIYQFVWFYKQWQANKIIYSFGTISFPFIYGVCLVNIFNIKIAIFILLIYFFINLISIPSNRLP